MGESGLSGSLEDAGNRDGLDVECMVAGLVERKLRESSSAELIDRNPMWPPPHVSINLVRIGGSAKSELWF
ncbi:hypothetical protein RBWH47_00765 [Rhodopirellula baltica WH47]|uniref:Uncharacterized protein n=1 Tax=Rhodopirellula baltica WH47 TaxID=991778 RepID=F2AWM6_RHOBT|nr:hypothetical protein RBWH47_00765 [Rhodopirellula baltica WH47]